MELCQLGTHRAEESTPTGWECGWENVLGVKPKIKNQENSVVLIFTAREDPAAAAAAAAKSLQSCLTLCDPIDSSPPGSPVPGILQARTLKWVAISFSKGKTQQALIVLLHVVEKRKIFLILLYIFSFFKNWGPGDLQYYVSFRCTTEGFSIFKAYTPGLPWWSTGCESACQCRGHRFYPWSGKIPHAAGQLSPYVTSTELVL